MSDDVDDDRLEPDEERHAGAVPETVPELFWRLAFFAAGIAFAGVAL